MTKFYVTTPIYYVNDVPHVGHAYTTLAADIIARYYRQKLGEKNVFFLTGTDEHGANVAQAAQKHKKTPQEYADEVVPRFKHAWKILNIEYDYFIRTTDPRHEKLAQEVLKKIYDKGYIYPGTYEGWYCVGCERFLTPSDLVKEKCPLHPTRDPIYQKENNYFLKLKDLAKILLPKIEKGEYKIFPQERFNEVVNRIKQGVEDISISRSGVSWGIPVPWDKSQTIYVWVEALLNYYTATLFVEGKQSFWPPTLQLMAKDIVWFHTVIWQALLLASDLALPNTIFAHGFFTINGSKMSKSLGNVISPEQLVETYTTDGARYLLISAYQFGSDGDLSLTAFKKKFNADLANGLGNLIARVAKLCNGLEFPEDSKNSLPGKYKKNLENYQFDEALKSIWEEIRVFDRRINESEPWKIKDKKLLLKTLQPIVVGIRNIAFQLQPFLPQTAQIILTQFQGKYIQTRTPLFPRLPYVSS